MPHPSAALLLLLVSFSCSTTAYWYGECSGEGPAPFVLPDNIELDCGLRSLALEYGTKSLAYPGAPPTRGVEGLRRALNIAVCPNTTTSTTAAAPRSTSPSPAPPAAIGETGSRAASTGTPTTPPTTTFIYASSSSGNDQTGTGAKASPFQSVGRAQRAARAARAAAAHDSTHAVTVYLRQGTYFAPPATAPGPLLTLTPSDSGASSAAPVTYASFPGERATLSGGLPLAGLQWADAAPVGGKAVFRAVVPASMLPPPTPSGGSSNNGSSSSSSSSGSGGSGGGSHVDNGNAGGPGGATATYFTGLFTGHTTLLGPGRRLTRARFPNCEDITGNGCFTLNASGPTPGTVKSPTHDLLTGPGGAENLAVINTRGFDMFAQGERRSQEV